MKLINRVCNFFSHPIYRSLLNCYIDENLDLLINELCEKNIADITRGEFQLYIMFDDGYTATIWIKNKWYAYMTLGNIKYNDILVYKWNGKRPKRNTMFRFYTKIECFISKDILINILN